MVVLSFMMMTFKRHIKKHSQWLKVRKENQYLVSRVDTHVLSNETLECKVQALETLVVEK